MTIKPVVGISANSALTLRPQNTYMHVFRALLDCWSRTKLVKFYTKFRVNQATLFDV